MLLAELLAGMGATDGAEQGVGATMPRRFAANPMAPGIVIGPVVLHGMGAPLRRMLAEDPAAELVRLATAASTMRQSLDDLIENRLPAGDGPRAVLEATRMVSAGRQLDAPRARRDRWRADGGGGGAPRD